MPHIHKLTDTNAHFLINPFTREIISNNENIVLVQGDHDSEMFTFELSRYVDGHDMSLCNSVKIYYENISSDLKKNSVGSYKITDLSLLNNDTINFSWIIDQNSTMYDGRLTFSITLECTNEDNAYYSWNTTVFDSITILKSLSKIESDQEQETILDLINKLVGGDNSLSATERLTELIKYGNAVTGSNNTTITDVIESLINIFDPAGLYDDEGTLICSYDDLVNIHGLNAEMDYTKDTYLTEPSSGYNVLKKPELATGTKLILDTEYVGKYAFSVCDNLTSVEIRRAKTMSDATFASCQNLTTAKIYSESIGNATFQNCSKLESCDIHYAESLEGYTFNNCVSLKSLNLPDELKRIGKQTFHGCESITSIVLPSNIESIGSFAFKKCYNLESVVFPEKRIKMDGQSIFTDCINLKSIENMNVDFFGTCRFTFGGCTALEYIDLSGCDMTQIEDATAMLQTCAKLKQFKFPKNMVISDYTFNHIGPYMTDDGVISIPSDCRLLTAHPQEGHIFYDFSTSYNNAHKRFSVNENNQYFKADKYGALYTKNSTSLLSLPMYMEVENGRYEMAEGVDTLWLMSFNRNQTINTLVIPNSLILSEEKGTSIQGEPDTYPNYRNNLTVSTHIYTNIRKFDCKQDHPYHSAYGGGIYSKDYKKLITMPIDYVGVFDIKDGCTTICGDSFRYNYGPSDITGLTQVNIPASTTDIKEYNFKKLNALTQVIKVVHPDNPVYEVINNIIVLKPLEPESKYRIEIYNTEKVPYEEKPGTITARAFVRINVSKPSMVTSETGIIYCTRDDIGNPIIDGSLNPEWKKKLITSLNNTEMPGYCCFSYSISGVPEGKFVRYVAFATVKDVDGEHFIYSNEVKIENDGMTTSEDNTIQKSRMFNINTAYPDVVKDYLEPDPAFDFE